MDTQKKWVVPLMIWGVFETVAVTLWLTKDNLFYLFNFSYIGSTIAIGFLLLQFRYQHGLSRTDMSGKYADRRLLVLSVYRCF